MLEPGFNDICVCAVQQPGIGEIDVTFMDIFGITLETEEQDGNLPNLQSVECQHDEGP